MARFRHFRTSHPRPKVFSASRSDLVLRARMSLFSVGECRWTTTPGCPDPQQGWSTSTTSLYYPIHLRRALVSEHQLEPWQALRVQSEQIAHLGHSNQIEG